MKKFDNYDAFQKFKFYVRELAEQQKDEKKPFNCPNLAVAPETVCIEEDGHFREIESGELLCRFGSALGYGRARCSVRSFVKPCSGGLELKCEQGSSLTVSVENFGYRKPF